MIIIALSIIINEDNSLICNFVNVIIIIIILISSV
jgi:hypothetical protein